MATPEPQPPTDDDDAGTVQRLLAAAGLHPPEDDVRTLVSQYGVLRRQLADVWAVDVGDDEPATIFRAGVADEAGSSR